MNKPVWFCRKIGEDGVIVICADQIVGEGLMGYRQSIHPLQLDNVRDPRGCFMSVIAEMSEIMGRVSAQPQPASRACAFGGGQ
ncbi:hypothetical protein H8F21_22145 [Pseudomonas sp. P66]|uniref:Uncharacterized protein n=2 Tax=Pseudomonas TaxID=286 RepID=A0ABS0BUG6_9PSED|nr:MULTISPECIES: hypothetical protein [Pseudomonas]MBF6037242.1 hypothetical protein [Pseudomonas neuropathica]MBM5460269.1 hypothetical protein [Pseudomonas arcuscaelestis]